VSGAGVAPGGRRPVLGLLPGVVTVGKFGIEQARAGPYMGEPGRSRLNPTAASCGAASSSPSGRCSTSLARFWSRIAGCDPDPVVLLGGDLREGLPEVCQVWCGGVFALVVPDRMLELALVARQLEGG